MAAGPGGCATPAYRYLERRRRNSETGSRRNIGAHYDLGNDFFQLFLDDSMTYSAGVFPTAATSLADAQRRKYDLICRKLDLQAGERVIEIGTGWGGFALHAAQHYGVHVTTTTISEQQHAMAAERIRAAGLEDRIDLRFSDYRKLEGQYDKLVSIEMVEAVGHDYFPTYLRKVAELLTPQGQALIQAITIRDHNYDVMRASQDFIREYIFPGGQLPCVAELLNVARHHTDLNLFDPGRLWPGLRHDLGAVARRLSPPRQRSRGAGLQRGISPHVGLLPGLLRRGLPRGLDLGGAPALHQAALHPRAAA